MKTGAGSKLLIVGILILFGIIGIKLLAGSHAATAAVSLEAEAGSATSPASLISDSSASGGTAVVFGTPASSNPNLPSRILDLTNWKITLPIDGKGSVVTSSSTCSAEEIDQPALANYSISPWFISNSDHTGVIFRANIEGCTTSGSGYPRSELREEAHNGTTDASWSTTSGTHTMQLTEAVTHLPVAKPQTTFAQIHNASDDVFEAEATGQPDGTVHLNVNHNGGVWGSDLDDNYVLGTMFTLKIVAGGGYIDVYYNGVQKVHEASSTSGDYFKAGDYTQSNIVKGKDAPGAYGEVIIYSLQVSHDPAL